jgi:hypothetical protein
MEVVSSNCDWKTHPENYWASRSHKRHLSTKLDILHNELVKIRAYIFVTPAKVMSPNQRQASTKLKPILLMNTSLIWSHPVAAGSRSAEFGHSFWSTGPDTNLLLRSSLPEDVWPMTALAAKHHWNMQVLVIYWREETPLPKNLCG